MYASDWDSLCFLRVVTQFNGTIEQVTGPASAFSLVLMELNWTIDLEGIIHATAFTKFSLVNSSAKRLRRFLENAWMDGLLMRTTNRCKHFNSGTISRSDTVAILKSFPALRHPTLIKHMAFASQLVDQRLHWQEDADGSCLLCQHPDSRTHRLFHCPVGNDIRESFSKMITDYDEEGCTLAEFSMITVHPYADAFQSLHFQATGAILAPEVLQYVQTRQNTGANVYWFTDGSVEYPDTPSTSFGAYSIILDLATSDEQRKEQAYRFAKNPEAASTLACVGAARIQGEQVILRGEFQAATCVMKQAGYGTLFIDSQAAIFLLEQALHATDWKLLAKYEHCDILIDLWHWRDKVSVELRKIKAHVDIEDITSPMDRYFQMGNWYADSRAKQANHELQSDFVSSLKEMHADMQIQRKFLHDVLDLHWQLHPVRVSAYNNLQITQRQKEQRSESDILTAFATWELREFYQLPQVLPSQWLSKCIWGERIAFKLLDWLAAIKWPKQGDESGPLNRMTGTAWHELALSFMFHQRTWLPVKRVDSDGQIRVMEIGSHQQAQDYAIDLGEQAVNLRLLIDQVSALVPTCCWPKLERRKIPSLYIQGSGQYVQGLRVRPLLPCQRQVAEQIHMRFSGTAASMTGHWRPEFALEERPLVILPGNWKARQLIVDKAFRGARLARSAASSAP